MLKDILIVLLTLLLVANGVTCWKYIMTNGNQKRKLEISSIVHKSDEKLLNAYRETLDEAWKSAFQYKVELSQACNNIEMVIDHYEKKGSS